MTLDQVLNFAKVTVSTGYDASATSIILTGGDGAKLPDPATGNYNLVWWDATSYGDPSDDPKKEIVRVTGKSTDTLTVTRNQESSGASTKNTADRTYKMILSFTKKSYDELGTSTTVADTASATTWPLLTESVTGTLAPKSDAGLTYNATTAALTVGSLITAGTVDGVDVSTLLDANLRLPTAKLPTKISNSYWHASWNERTVVQGTWAQSNEINQTDFDSDLKSTAGYVINNSSADGDEIHFGDLILNAGTYNVKLTCLKSFTYNGIIEILHGTTSLGIVDTNNGSTIYNSTVTFTYSPIVRVSGNLRVKVSGTTSTDYFVYFSRLEITSAPVNITGNASGSAATVTTAAQTNITSLGTLTALTVDNIYINTNDISSTSGNLTLTPVAGSNITLDGTIVIDAGVVTGATSITSTAFVGLPASIYLGVEGAYLPNTNPAVLNEAASSGVYSGWSYLSFDKTTAQSCMWRVPLIGYNGGNIIVTAYAKCQTTPIGNVSLIFDIYTIGIANGEEFNSAVLTDTTTNLSLAFTTSTHEHHMVTASASIDPANVADGDLLCFGLTRDVASDDLDCDGQLLGVLIQYTKV